MSIKLSEAVACGLPTHASASGRTALVTPVPPSNFAWASGPFIYILGSSLCPLYELRTRLPGKSPHNFTCITAHDDWLAAGTDTGFVAFWKMSRVGWTFHSYIHLESIPRSLSLGGSLVAAICTDSLSATYTLGSFTWTRSSLHPPSAFVSLSPDAVYLAALDCDCNNVHVLRAGAVISTLFHESPVIRVSWRPSGTDYVIFVQDHLQAIYAWGCLLDAPGHFSLVSTIDPMNFGPSLLTVRLPCRDQQISLDSFVSFHADGSVHKTVAKNIVSKPPTSVSIEAPVFAGSVTLDNLLSLASPSDLALCDKGSYFFTLSPSGTASRVSFQQSQVPQFASVLTCLTDEPDFITQAQDILCVGSLTLHDSKLFLQLLHVSQFAHIGHLHYSVCSTKALAVAFFVKGTAFVAISDFIPDFVTFSILSLQGQVLMETSVPHDGDEDTVGTPVCEVSATHVRVFLASSLVDVDFNSWSISATPLKRCLSISPYGEYYRLLYRQEAAHLTLGTYALHDSSLSLVSEVSPNVDGAPRLSRDGRFLFAINVASLSIYDPEWGIRLFSHTFQKPIISVDSCYGLFAISFADSIQVYAPHTVCQSDDCPVFWTECFHLPIHSDASLVHILSPDAFFASFCHSYFVFPVKSTGIHPSPIYHPQTLSFLLAFGYFAQIVSLVAEITSQARVRSLSDAQLPEELPEHSVALSQDSIASFNSVDSPPPGFTATDLHALKGFVNSVFIASKLSHAFDQDTLAYLTAVNYLAVSEPVPWALSLTETHEFAPKVDISLARTDSKTSLIDSVVQAFGGKLSWKNACDSGVPLLISSQAELTALLGFLSRAESSTEDPVLGTLFLLAQGNKRASLLLWKHSYGHPQQAAVSKFLTQDFSQQKSRAAAAKNAFVLLSQRRFRLAVAFFILAGDCENAVQVCANQLADIQLAYLLTLANPQVDVSTVHADEISVPHTRSFVTKLILPHALSHDAKVFSCLLGLAGLSSYIPSALSLPANRLVTLLKDLLPNVSDATCAPPPRPAPTTIRAQNWYAVAESHIDSAFAYFNWYGASDIVPYVNRTLGKERGSRLNDADADEPKEPEVSNNVSQAERTNEETQTGTDSNGHLGPTKSLKAELGKTQKPSQAAVPEFDFSSFGF